MLSLVTKVLWPKYRILCGYLREFKNVVNIQPVSFDVIVCPFCDRLIKSSFTEKLVNIRRMEVVSGEPEVFTSGGKSLCCRLPFQLVEEIAHCSQYIQLVGEDQSLLLTSCSLDIPPTQHPAPHSLRIQNTAQLRVRFPIMHPHNFKY